MRHSGEVKDSEEVAFEKLAKLAYSESGLILVPEKYLMVQSRLRPRMKSLGLRTIADYQSFVCSNDGANERRHMISSLTTNVSHFFREAHHFDLLRQNLEKRVNTGSCDRVRIWSAGCSNGQEATTIAISLLEAIPDLVKLDFKILATDIDPTVVKFATEGNYPERMMSGLTKNHVSEFFSREDSLTESHFKLKPKIRNLITYRELNLLKDWPMKSSFDAIFCRNVVIYFDAETQLNLWPRFHKILRDDGIFFLGHSERISEPNNVGFKSVGPTAYVKST